MLYQMPVGAMYTGAMLYQVLIGAMYTGAIGAMYTGTMYRGAMYTEAVCTGTQSHNSLDACHKMHDNHRRNELWCPLA